MVGGVGTVPAGGGAEADPGALITRNDTSDGFEAVLTVSAILFLQSQQFKMLTHSKFKARVQ